MSIVKYSQPKRSDSTDAATLSFESATAEIVNRHYPVRERAVIYVLAALVVSILVFISVAHLDRVVAAEGRIVPTGGAVTVQPLEKAIISRILVSVGDVVKKGQVLATCDPTFVQADLTALQEKVASLEAQKRRMEAEEAGQRFNASPSKSHDLLQSSIWEKRFTEFKAGLTDFDQRIHSSEAQIVGFRQSIANLKAQLKIAKETEDMYTKMESAGIATHLDLIGVQNKTLEIVHQLTDQENALAAAEPSLESLKEQRKVYFDKWHDDNLDKLSTVRDEYEQAVNDLAKAQKLSELVDLVSPGDAVVLKVPTLSVGGVATDAQPLFSLMPVDAPIEVDAHIEAQDSGFVKVGDPVTIKFSTYKFLEHGTAEGVVKTISQDAFTETNDQDTVSTKSADSSASRTAAPYFDARITVTALHLHDVPRNVRLIPGMTLQADIVVGRRTIMWYLLGGAMRSGAEAMREP
ncbi:MAG TPA: HlyD family type I secretion periplasmic adaptor subunit [Candidatus Sulfotelmatobacter sp.]|nr:HlyD family type I secretion periplasmic adaptor subunit [Candidatus Sulfotelmatobacter sp.]